LNWNALEWDRAAEELTWERVRMCFFLLFYPSMYFFIRCLAMAIEKKTNKKKTLESKQTQ